MSAINRYCPRSGAPVDPRCVTAYRGLTVGFCNPQCRDDFEAHTSECPDDRRYFDALIREHGLDTDDGKPLGNSERNHRGDSATPESPALGRRDATPESDRVRLRRAPDNAVYDRDRIYDILDRHMLAHVGFELDGQPWVVPMLYVRFGDALYLHGSRASRMIKQLAQGAAACVTVTHLDGLVLSRAAFDTSVNYRSVMALGRCTLVESEEDKRSGVMAVLDALVPGRAGAVRPPSRKELAATALLRFKIEECSGKQRRGPPGDQAKDLSRDAWAGVIPILTHYGAPEPDPRQPEDKPVPKHVHAFAAHSKLLRQPDSGD